MGDFQLDSAPLSRVDKKLKRQYLHIDRAPLRNGILLKLGYMDKKQLADDLRQALSAV